MPSLQVVLYGTVVGALVGNLDMHAKNISMLHLPDGSARLAPAYDVVPLTHYPGVDGRMAMSVNGVYVQHRISRDDLVAEAERWGLGTDRAEATVERTVSIIRDTAQREQPHARAYAGLPEAIDTAARRLVEADNATRS